MKRKKAGIQIKMMCTTKKASKQIATIPATYKARNQKQAIQYVKSLQRIQARKTRKQTGKAARKLAKNEVQLISNQARNQESKLQERL